MTTERMKLGHLAQSAAASIFIHVFHHLFRRTKFIPLSKVMMLEISGSEPAEVVTQARARSATKLRAIDDAMEMRSVVGRECAESNITPPPFTLLELIGKGSFGRVYKAASQTTGSLVAVKIINIEQGDRAAPGASDTFAEILKEVNTVKLLSGSGAKNINVIVDALLIGQSMWMVTEYCGGGSVATLMRPTGYLLEMWIIPILREVAEAIFWVHKQGIIHRDIKCANVLVAEDGGVQLCDFGVAGMVKSRFDKRKTVTGTLQWMAPELFDTDVSYGNEVDIWAFGSMAYEAATGLPPNASMSAVVDMDLEQFGEYLRDSCPRLEGDQYSTRLKDLIAYCMVPDPAKRPRIENVQRHDYIFDTEQIRPTSVLAKLVAAYKKWESEGGDRKSLFSPGGAQGLTPDESHSAIDGEWDYGTMNDSFPFDKLPAMAEVNMPLQPQPQPRRRHGKPLHVRVSKPPLEKAFDPNTISNYHTNARRFYGAPSLPPCDNTETDNVDTLRESPVRHGSGATSATSDTSTCKRMNSDAETLRPGGPSRNPSCEKAVTFNTSKTQDWTFPVMTPDVTSPTNNSDPGFGPPSMPASPAPTSSTGTRTRAGTLHSRRTSSLSNRLSVISLIDLDASLDMGPSTASTQPDIPTTTSEDPAAAPLCEEIRQQIQQSTSNSSASRSRLSEVSLINLDASLSLAAPSNMAEEETVSPMCLDSTLLNTGPTDSYSESAEPTTQFYTGPSPPLISLPSPTTETFPTLDDSFPLSSSPISTHHRIREPSLYIPTLGIIMDSASSEDVMQGMDSPTIPRIVVDGDGDDGHLGDSRRRRRGSNRIERRFRRGPPELPAPPAEEVILGYGGREELRDELERLIGGMWEHLEYAEDVMGGLPVVEGD